MGILEKIKNFFGLGTIVFDTWLSDDYEKIENILKEMGGCFVKEYGMPTAVDGKIYKVNGYRIVMPPVCQGRHYVEADKK